MLFYCHRSLPCHRDGLVSFLSQDHTALHWVTLSLIVTAVFFLANIPKRKKKKKTPQIQAGIMQLVIIAHSKARVGDCRLSEHQMLAQTGKQLYLLEAALNIEGRELCALNYRSIRDADLH